MKSIPRIETERLLLTWPSAEQIDQYHRDIIGTNMFDTILWEGPKDESELHQYWKECSSIDPKKFSDALGFSIIKKETNEYVGGCALRPVNGNHHIIDVGFALAPKFHNNGYATEAIKALVHEAFHHREAIRVFGTVFVGNTPSKRVFEKLGFSLEGTLRSVVQKRGEWRDEWIMAMTKEDWENSDIYRSL